ncbi:hypothetical protein AXF42_Ash021334 [Apostasia shenzhenica]|uniref:Uncharacterized protein n=1 Tax=Apostasia shenzhenica TaxID=1088818 RepID=A0A2H9ZZW0_9ASPA|nr:hypothetical protein AXF42_Ash021334 [Apostasia shenzhenica]
MRDKWRWRKSHLYKRFIEPVEQDARFNIPEVYRDFISQAEWNAFVVLRSTPKAMLRIYWRIRVLRNIPKSWQIDIFSAHACEAHDRSRPLLLHTSSASPTISRTLMATSSTSALFLRRVRVCVPPKLPSPIKWPTETTKKRRRFLLSVSNSTQS